MAVLLASEHIDRIRKLKRRLFYYKENCNYLASYALYMEIENLRRMLLETDLCPIFAIKVTPENVEGGLLHVALTDFEDVPDGYILKGFVWQVDYPANSAGEMFSLACSHGKTLEISLIPQFSSDDQQVVDGVKLKYELTDPNSPNDQVDQ